MVLIQSLWCWFTTHPHPMAFKKSLDLIFSINNGLKQNFKTEIFLLVYLEFLAYTFSSEEAPAICSCLFNLLLNKYFQ